MSDPAAEPGAPKSGAINIPPASDKSVAKAVSQKAPQAVGIVSYPDRTILRLNKCAARVTERLTSIR